MWWKERIVDAHPQHLFAQHPGVTTRYLSLLLHRLGSSAHSKKCTVSDKMSPTRGAQCGESSLGLPGSVFLTRLLIREYGAKEQPDAAGCFLPGLGGRTVSPVSSCPVIPREDAALFEDQLKKPNGRNLN